MKKRQIVNRLVSSTACFILLAAIAPSAFCQPEVASTAPISERMISLLSRSPENLDSAFADIDRNWQASWTPMVLELMYLTNSADVRSRLHNLLREKTGQRFGNKYVIVLD